MKGLQNRLLKSLAKLGLMLSFLLAAAASAPAQWYQSRHAGDYRGYDSSPGYNASDFSRGYTIPSRTYSPEYGSGDTGSAGNTDWPGRGFFRSRLGDDRTAPTDVVSLGRRDFWRGHYDQALAHWELALAENPDSGVIRLLLAQAYFALGKYEAAASAAQAGMHSLPQRDWGSVVRNYRHVYANIQDYTDQLRKLEAARTAQPDDVTLRFLLGYHFGFLGYPRQAVTELDKALALQPDDINAKQLQEGFAAQMRPAERQPHNLMQH
jgi:tetratricopeptide (TPR) repeat protein